MTTESSRDTPAREESARTRLLALLRRNEARHRLIPHPQEGRVSGSIVPFTFDPDLELVVDPALLEHEEIFFSAADLALSVALDFRDYVRIACPRAETISEVV